MKLKDFIGYSIDELLAVKRNSFLHSNIQTHDELPWGQNLRLKSSR